MVVSIKLWEGIFHATSQPVYAERFSWHIAILLSTMALPINYFSHKRNLKELFDLKDDDDSGHGYIEGRVFMVWHPHNSMFHIQLEVPKDSTPCRFTIEIPYMHSILLHPQDQILLALKDVKVNGQKESSVPFSFPMALHFPYSMVLKYLNGINAGRSIHLRKGTSVIDS